MLLENGAKWLKKILEYDGSSTSLNVGGLKDINGVTVETECIVTSSKNCGFSPLNTNAQTNCEKSGPISALTNGSTIYKPNGTFSQSSFMGGGVMLGDGNTDPQYSDYTLSGNMITDFTASVTAQISQDANYIYAIASYIITNTGASVFTIREMGITVRSASTAKAILMTKEKLATPLTIAAGESGTLTYRLNLIALNA